MQRVAVVDSRQNDGTYQTTSAVCIKYLLLVLSRNFDHETTSQQLCTALGGRWKRGTGKRDQICRGGKGRTSVYGTRND